MGVGERIRGWRMARDHPPFPALPCSSSLELPILACPGGGAGAGMDLGLPRGHAVSSATCWPRLPRASVQPRLALSPAGPARPHSASRLSWNSRSSSLRLPALIPRPPFIRAAGLCPQLTPRGQPIYQPFLLGGDRLQEAPPLGLGELLWLPPAPADC